MEIRTEYGFQRIACACRRCAINCEYIPGYLVPEDIPRIMDHLNITDEKEFAKLYLRASNDTIVQRGSEQFRVKTLVPRRQSGGACKFLTANKLCSIHEVSPFGCAFFDHTMVPTALEHADDGHDRALVSLNNIEGLFRRYEGQYVRLWFYLNRNGWTSANAFEVRRAMAKQLKREGLEP